MMVACIHQPDFAPWMGFFDRLVLSDVYVVLDNVQFLRRGWHHRDLIKTPKGPKWLTVPVIKKGRYHQDILDVEIDNTKDWRRDHLNAIREHYSNSPFFNDHIGEIEKIYSTDWKILVDLNMAIINMFIEAFGIKVEIVNGSSLGVQGSKNELLINILKSIGSKQYIAGEGSKSYLDEALFDRHGIEVIWQSFAHPVYPQEHGEFLPELSSYDALLNCGSKYCAQIFKG